MTGPARFVGEHADPGNENNDNASRGELTQPMTHLVFTPGQAAQLPDCEIHSSGRAKSQQYPDEYVADKPRGDCGQLIDQIEA